MNREEVREKFPDISDEQLNWLMDANGKDINKAKRDGKKDGEASKQSEIDDLTSQIADLEGANNDKLTAEQRAEKAEQKLAKMEADYAIKTNRVDAEQQFIKAGLDEELYSPLLESVVSADSEQTSLLVSNIINAVDKQSVAAVKAAQKTDLANMRKPNGGEGGGGGVVMTREEFNALGYEGRAKLKAEDPDTYNSFYA